MNHETDVGDCGGTQTASKQVWRISGPSLQVKSLVNHINVQLQTSALKAAFFLFPMMPRMLASERLHE